jgi:hypothetical protein
MQNKGVYIGKYAALIVIFPIFVPEIDIKKVRNRHKNRRRLANKL